MCHRRLTAFVLVVGGFLLLGYGRIYGQRWNTPPAAPRREVIATAVAVTPETASLPSAPTPVAKASTPVASAPGSSSGPLPEAIQKVSYVPDAPSNASAAPPPEPAAPMLPPSALFSGMRRSSGATNAPSPPSPPDTSGATNAPSPPDARAAMLSVEVVGPDQVMLGRPLPFEIVIHNRGAKPVAEVHVEEPLPEGVHALSTDPRAVMRENRLTWDLRHLEPGGERRIKVELNPGRAEALDLRPYVTFLNGSGLRTRVQRPPFAIEMSADRTKAVRGERIRFNIQLANHGLAPIQNIKIYDKLPPGLHHPSARAGRVIGIEHFGDLQPGQKCTIALETTAVESGSFRNEIVAQADRGVESKAVLDGVIVEPSLSLRIEGPDKALTRREVDFHLEIANPGSLAAKNVRLVQALPPTFEIVSASNDASLDINHHALVWSLPTLGAGHRQTLTFRIRANLAGDWPMTAAVLSQNFPEARVPHTLHAEAAAALKVEVHAREEILSVGEETVFRMRVLNNGDAPCTGLRLTATLPECVTLVKAEGPSSEQIEKQQVWFAAAQLDPHSDGSYRLRVRGRQAGKGSVRVEVTADKQAPAAQDVSIQVHEGKLATTEKISNSIPGQSLR